MNAIDQVVRAEQSGSGWNALGPGQKPAREDTGYNPAIGAAYEYVGSATYTNSRTGRTITIGVVFDDSRLNSKDAVESAMREEAIRDILQRRSGSDAASEDEITNVTVTVTQIYRRNR
jgi:hypothetical protein